MKEAKNYLNSTYYLQHQKKRDHALHHHVDPIQYAARLTIRQFVHALKVLLAVHQHADPSV